MAQRAARAEALYEVSKALTSTQDLNQVLDLITEQAARLLNFDSAQILLQQDDGSFASLGAYGRPSALGGDITVPGGGCALLEPISKELWERREPRMVHWSGPGGEPDRAGDMALVLPMRYGTSVSGVLILSNAGGRVDCSQDDVILGQGLADQAAVAIANAHLLAQVRETAMLEERTRLARDIHDILAQGLTGVVVQRSARLQQRRMKRARISRWPSAWPANHWARRGGRCGICVRRRSIGSSRTEAKTRLHCRRAPDGSATSRGTSAHSVGGRASPRRPYRSGVLEPTYAISIICSSSATCQTRR